MTFSLTPNIENMSLIKSKLITNITLHENELYKRIKPVGNILKVSSNFGEVFNPSYVDPPTKIKSAKGRKKRLIVKRRKPRGNGLYFPSQSTFLMKGTVVNYKMKLFSNGSIQAPGVTLNRIDEAIQLIYEIRDAVKLAYGLDVLDTNCMPLVDYNGKPYHIILSNSKTKIYDTVTIENCNVLVLLNELYKLLKELGYHVAYNQELSQGLKVVINEPTTKPMDTSVTYSVSVVTVLVYSSGKINLFSKSHDKTASIQTICKILLDYGNRFVRRCDMVPNL